MNWRKLGFSMLVATLIVAFAGSTIAVLVGLIMFVATQLGVVEAITAGVIVLIVLLITIGLYNDRDFMTDEV